MTYTKSTVLPVAPEEAFALLTEPERLRRWQTVSARVDLRAGGEYRWTVTPGHVAAGTFREVEPGKRVVFGWGWEGNPDLLPDASTVTVTVEPTDGGTRVTLEHAGLTEEQAVGHAEGWNHYFERLEEVAVSGDAGPDAWSAVPAQLDELSSAEATLAVLQGVLRNLTVEDQPKQTPCTEFTCHDLAEHLFGSIIGLGRDGRRHRDQPGDRIAGAPGRHDGGRGARGLAGPRPRRDGPVPGRRRDAGCDGRGHPLGGVPAARVGLRPGQRPGGRRRRRGGRLRPSIAEKLVPGARERGAFAEEQTPAADAGPLERLAAYAGRTPLAA